MTTVGLTRLASVAISEGAWIAIGGWGTAGISGVCALIGIYVSTSRQKQPRVVTTDADELRACRVRLEEVTADRDRWREIAMGHLVGRRSDDPKPSSFDLDD